MSRTTLCATAAALALLPCIANAAADPTPGPKDSRIRSTPYDPRQVLRVVSTGLSPVQLIYEQGETPVTIAGLLVGLKPEEAKDWLAQKSGNTLTLQPLHDMGPSVLFVRTQRADGKERHYAYELSTRPGNIADAHDKQAYMEVDYIYQHEATPEEIAAAQARKAASGERWAHAKLAQAQFSAPRNYLYQKRDPVGCPDLAPMRVSDDGHTTTLLFAPHAVVPEAYPLTPDAKESVVQPVATTTEAGLLEALPGVYRDIRLRRGGKVCELRNLAFDPVGTQPGNGSGTTSPEVIRTVRETAR